MNFQTNTKKINEINQTFTNLTSKRLFKETYTYLKSLRNNSEYSNNRNTYLAILEGIFKLADIPNQTIVPLELEAKELINYFIKTNYKSEREAEFLFTTSFMLLNKNKLDLAKSLIDHGLKMKKDLDQTGFDLECLSLNAKAEYNFKLKDFTKASKYFLELIKLMDTTDKQDKITAIITRIKLYESLKQTSSYKNISKRKILLKVVDLFTERKIESDKEIQILSYFLNILERENNSFYNLYRNKLIVIENEFYGNKQKKKKEKGLKAVSLNEMLKNTSKLVIENDGITDEAESYLANLKNIAEENKDTLFLIDILFSMCLLYDGNNDQDYLITVALKLKKLLVNNSQENSPNKIDISLAVVRILIKNKKYKDSNELLNNITKDLKNEDNETHLATYYQRLGEYYAGTKDLFLAKKYFKNSYELFIFMDNDLFQAAVSCLGYINSELFAVDFDLLSIKPYLDSLYAILSKNSVKKSTIETYTKALLTFKILGMEEEMKEINKLIENFFNK